MSLEVPRADKALELQLELEGMQTIQRTVAPLADENLSYEFQTLAAPVPATAPEEGAAAEVKKKKRGRSLPLRSAPTDAPKGSGDKGDGGATGPAFKPMPDYEGKDGHGG